MLEALSINIERAQKEKNTTLLQRLQFVLERINARIRADLPPEMMFIEELLNQPSFEEAQTIIQERAAEFGDRLPQMLDVLIQDFVQRGGPEQAPMIAQLQQILTEVERALGDPTEATTAELNPSAASELPAEPPRPTLLRSGRSEAPPANAKDNPPADKPKIEILRGGKYTPLPPRDQKK